MKLEILVGMIASGKSTYARKRADEGAIVVCHDDLTAMLHGRYRYEQGLRSAYREAEEAIASTFIAAGRDVVIDRTHLTRESRERWIKFARWGVFTDVYPIAPTLIVVVFPNEGIDVHAGRRFDADPRGRSLEDWRGVAELHCAQALTEPLDWKSEGFDGVTSPEFARFGMAAMRPEGEAQS